MFRQRTSTGFRLSISAPTWLARIRPQRYASSSPSMPRTPLHTRPASSPGLRRAIAGAMLAVALAAETSLLGQTPRSAERAKPWAPPRTPWGHPDLQGTWTDGTTTPLERPKAIADKDTYTDDELAIVRKQAPEGAGNAYDEFWYYRRDPLLRTSLIVD